MTATTTIEAAPDAVFAVLADPATHADIDGTGWVRSSLDAAPLTGTGQVFRMAMFHENHPDKDYEMANRVEYFRPTEGDRLEARAGVAGDRRAGVRRVGLALRTDTERPGADRRDAHL